MKNIKTINGIGNFDIDTLEMLIDDDNVIATFELSSVSPEFEKKYIKKLQLYWEMKKP